MNKPLLLLVLIYTISCSPQKLELEKPSPLDKDALTPNKSLVNTTKSPYAKLEAIGIEDIKFTTGFWAERVKTCTETMLPEMWSIYKDPDVSHAVRNFEIAAGLEEGQHEGAPFHDGDFYKLIEAASMAYALTKNEKFDQMIDEVIPLIDASQRADGYIHTPVMIQTKNNPETAVEFRDRMDFESYNMGHLMTAATVHYKATGKTSLLELAKKAADYLYTYTEKFPEKMAQNAICPSHYMGIIEMYRTTGDERYYELGKKFIDIRSLMKDGTDHNQDRIPFREQTQAIGHAVRANYLYAGVADVYAETGDETLKTALDKIWNNLVSTKLYITGGCGALYDGVSPNGTTYDQPAIQQVHQAYGREFELPKAGAHNETCANIGSVLWNWRMLQATGEAKYADLVELTLFNSILSGVNLNGKGYFYTNPLSNNTSLPFELRWPNVREEYISFSNCCPPNTIRTIAEVGNYMYSKDDKGLYLNMYSGNELTTSIGNETLSLEQVTDYPWSGEVKLIIKSAPQKETSLSFRIPDWCEKATVSINGKEAITSNESSSYATISQVLVAGDEITFTMEMPVTLIAANPSVEETQNQVAVKRGPVVYCLEANDLKEGQKLSDILIPADIALTPTEIQIANTSLKGLSGKAEVAASGNWDQQLYQKLSDSKPQSTDILLIPHFAWANRDEADMSIWLPLDR
ncbi:glycoside hydrolase family 127 protein [Marinoscillum sp. MHG1-6]|uniref:aceric acid hydrolase n=1 Tax=Marinoscillum sp. MHG1-6 TaxID=2959627 RepID=UPI0021574B0A|nr:glycoside hydrolase family 127 protein [Marinoscillum sp. MHG1-6]